MHTHHGIKCTLPEPKPLPAPEVLATFVAATDARVPASARSFAKAATATGHLVRITYARGAVPGEKARCPECSALTGIKLDGDLKVHGPVAERCAGGKAPEPELQVVDSILVRAQRDGRPELIMAHWVDGKADCAGIQVQGERKMLGIREAQAMLSANAT